MHPTAWKCLLAVLLLVVAAYLPFRQGLSMSVSTYDFELGSPPIVRVDYTVTDDLERIPHEPHLRYGFFVAVGISSVLCFAAGFLSSSAFVRRSPSPNHVLQRTGISGGASSDLHA